MSYVNKSSGNNQNWIFVKGNEEYSDRGGFTLVMSICKCSTAADKMSYSVCMMPSILPPQVLIAVCLALNYIHVQKKVVHRDLTPSNIVLGQVLYIGLGMLARTFIVMQNKCLSDWYFCVHLYCFWVLSTLHTVSGTWCFEANKDIAQGQARAERQAVNTSAHLLHSLHAELCCRHCSPSHG